MLSLLFLRCVCELIFLFNLFEPILNAPIGSILAETIGFEEGQCQHTTTTTGMTGIGGTTSMMHTPTSSAASSSSGVWKSAASLNEPDALTWLKLLFVPALGLLLLAALLEELCFASGSPQPTTLFGWFRQFCSRGPKLTTAYANQLKQNSLGLVGLHHTHSNGTCTCGHGANGLTNSHGSASLAVGMPSASSASGGLLLNDSNASPFAPLSLQLNFNGFNQLSGPLQYYNTFTREECDTIDTSSPKVMNGKHSTTTSPTSLAKRKDAPLSPNLSSPSASPSTPTLSTFSFSSPSSLTPPSSDFVPLTLVNESTGFSQTFSLWKHLTFGEILAYYIDSHWSDEKCKYDSAEYIHDDIPTDGPTSLTALATGTTNPTNTNASPTDGSNRTFSTPPLMLQYEGTRLSSLLTPASVFPSSSSSSSSSPSSIPRLTISTDYFLLFDRHRHRMNNQVAEKKAKFHRQELTRQEISERIHRLEDEAQTKQKAHKEVTDKLSVLSTELKKITKELDRLTKELDTLQKDRHEVQQSIGSSVGLIRNLKLRLQEEYSTLKASHDTRSAEYQQCKEKYSQGIEERHRLSNELKSSMIRYDTLSKRSNQLKQQKSKHEKLVEKIKKLEQVLAGVEGPISSLSSTTTNSDSKKDSSTISTTSSSTSSSASTSPSTSTSSLSSTSTAAQLDPLQAAARMKARYDQLEQEHNVLNVQLNELRLTSHEIDDLSKNEHYKLRYRLKLFEKDARDLQKWKSLARASEMDARQAIQWKMALRKLKQQEREWEKDEKEYHHWRRRARMIEKEVRDLRQWKARHLSDGLNDATVGAIGGVGVGVGVSTLLHSLQPPPPSASAPPGFEPRNTAATGQLEDTRRRAHSLTNENELLHGIGVGLGVSSSIVSPPSADLDGLFASAGVVGSSGFASFRSSLHSSRVTSGSGIVSDELNFGVIPSVDGAFDVDLPDDSDEEDFAHHSHAYGNFGSHASWNFSPATTSFDSHLLNSRTPNMRPRDQLRSTSPNRVGNVGSDIAAAASEHEPDFTHTLPAFLAE